MKRKLPTFLEAAVLSVLCAWGAVGCLISAFSLPLAVPNRVILVWACWALLCAALLLRRWGEAAVLTLATVGSFWLWREGSFGPQLLSTLGILAKVYDGGYGWGIPQVLQAEAQETDLPVTVLGMILIFAVSRTVCRRRDSGLAIGLLLLPLAACLVVTDTVPAEGYLFVLLMCLCLLLLTQSVRRDNGSQAGRLTVMAMVPVALALGLLMHFCPREHFVNTTGELRERILVSAMALPQKFQNQGLDWFSGLRQRQTVELSDLPAQLLLGVPVAEVTAEQSVPVYLRVQDYDVYTGTAWESSSGREDTLVGAGETRGMVTVKTLNLQSSLLLPSFPDGQTFLTDGTVKNGEDQREYTVTLRNASMGALPQEQWMKLPEQTNRRAKELLQAISSDLSSVEVTVAAVAEYVRSSAAYDRGSSTMTGEETDFALWFLEEADRGYCVHFATAAAVLLRSAGIPARYVTGYRAQTVAGETVKVTSDDAHAWVEYYNYHTWTWNILEVTPGENVPLHTEPVTETTQPTQPEPQTQPVTSPAEAATQPIPTTQSQTQSVPEEHPALPRWIALTIVAMGAAWAATELQRLVRIRLRRRRQTKGDNNARAAACCREIVVLSKLLKQPVPEVVLLLTEKALFSQHTLTRGELNVFLSCQTACRRALRKAAWWRRLLYRYWYAVI